MASDLSDASDLGVTTLVSGIVEDAQTLFRQQVGSIRTEIHEDFRKAKDAVLLLVVGALGRGQRSSYCASARSTGCTGLNPSCHRGLGF